MGTIGRRGNEMPEERMSKETVDKKIKQRNFMRKKIRKGKNKVGKKER